MPISLLSTAPFDQYTNTIRVKPVPWDGYQRASLVTPSELSLLKRIDRQPRAKQTAVFDSEPEVYAGLFLGLLGKLVRIDTVQTVLIEMGDMIGDDPLRIQLYLSLADKNPELPFGPLVKALSLPDEFVQVKAVQLLAVLISGSKTSIPTSVLKPALSLISTQLSNSDPKYRDVALLSLSSILASSSARKLLWSLSLPTSLEAPTAQLSLLPTLLKLLQQNLGGAGSGTPDTQLQYSLVFCFWELTFEKDVAKGIDRRFSLIPLLSNLALSSPKEKVLRLTLSTFKNLLFLPPSSPNSTVVLPAATTNPLSSNVAPSPPPASTLSALLPLLPHLTSLSSRKYNDEDLPADLADLVSTLKAGSANRSSWEAWSEEIRSGRLVPGEAHESEGFWLENKGKFENGMEGGELMKVLVDLLKNSGDAEVLAVACSDVGLYVQANGDRAKKFVNDLGAKPRVMELMSHESPDVRYRALMTVQKLINIG